MSVEKIYKKMECEESYVELKRSKLQFFIESEVFTKILSPEMQEIKKEQERAMKAYVKALSKARNQMRIEHGNELELKSFLSKGEEIIGRFHADGSDSIKEVKLGAINLINDIEDLGKDPRRKAVAFTEIEKGTIMAVKALLD